MLSVAQLEQEVLALPPQAREQLALAAWESLENDLVDPEGLAIALQRDAEMESGLVKPVSHEEFMRRTSQG